MNEKIQGSHLGRRAMVYLRQSTLKQVHEHGESTKRQYGLKERAIALGWPSDNIDIIDEDLGLSGTSTEGREGFQLSPRPWLTVKLVPSLHWRFRAWRAHRRIGTGCWNCAALRMRSLLTSEPSIALEITTTGY